MGDGSVVFLFDYRLLSPFFQTVLRGE